MARDRIGKRTVDAMRPEVGRDVMLWDSELTGFGLKVTPAGSKVYLVRYHSPTVADAHGGKSRVYTIGKHGPLTPEQARAEAKRVLGEVALGRDPFAEQRAAKTAATVGALTVSALCDLYLSEGCATKKPSTVLNDRSRIECHVRPILGGLTVAAVTRADVERFLQRVAGGETQTPRTKRDKPRSTSRVTGGKGVATRTVGLLGAVFGFAVRRGFRPDNPCAGVRRFADRKIERFLSEAELATLGEALADLERAGFYHPSGLGVIRLLLLTGCRRDEVRTLRWSWVDFDRRCLRLPDSKTGQKVVPIGAAAVAFLRGLEAGREADADCVFPGTEAGEPYSYSAVQKVWEATRRRAGLGSDVRLHDLRHAFASVGVAGGASLPILGKLLGHKHAATTQRYAHLSEDPVSSAADRIAGAVAERLGAGAARVGA